MTRRIEILQGTLYRRRLLGCICFLLLTVATALAAGDVAQLRPLVEKSQYFRLRELLQQPGWSDSDTLFYRALVESAFGHDAASIEDLQKFLAAPPADPKVQREAYEALSSSLARLGRYGDSARALAATLRVTPPDDADRANTENARALYESLADVAPQTVEFGPDVSTQATLNALGSWDVPVEVNGHYAKWIFDTGANLSTLSESEAARMGLTPRDTDTYVNGSTEKKNRLRLAVAHDLRFGNARLSNVALLVVPDEALYIGPLKYQIRGILGLPVLRALGQVGISAKGAVRIETKETAAAGEPNLFLDGLDLIVEARHGGQRLEMFLDTGANTSAGYPSLRETLTPEEIAKLKRKRSKTGGVGGTVTLETEVAPRLDLEILGRTEEIKNVSLLDKPLPGAKSYRDGVLGMDGLLGGFTLDFRNMQLRLD